MMRIGVLTLGWGLIVANELRRAFSNIGVVFIADSANFPYGNKSDEQLVDIVHDRIMLLERMVLILSSWPVTRLLLLLRGIASNAILR